MASEFDWVTAKALVREWLMQKGVALTGVNGEASRSTVHRFKLDLEQRIATSIMAERERSAKIASNALERLDALNTCCAEPMRAVLRAIREGKPQE